MAKFAGVELTEETIQKTREHFAQIFHSCVLDIEEGRMRVNDPDSAIKWYKENHNKAMSGQSDNNLTFLQRAHWIQTGEMIALLP